MNIHITADTQKLIEQQIAAGNCSSAEEAIERAVALWASSVSLPKDIDIEALARQQGVKPLINPTEQLRADSWSSDEPADEFLDALYELRSQGTPRMP